MKILILILNIKQIYLKNHFYVYTHGDFFNTLNFKL